MSGGRHFCESPANGREANGSSIGKRIVARVSNKPAYPSYKLYYTVEYYGADHIYVSIEEEASSYIWSSFIYEPYLAHGVATNLWLDSYAWIDVEASNEYGTVVETLEYVRDIESLCAL